MKRALLSLVTIVCCVGSALAADDNIRKAQARLKADGFYFGEVSGTFDNDTSAAITRYQITESIYRIRRPSLPASALTREGVVWVRLSELDHISMSGPHRRWVRGLLSPASS